MIEQEKKVGTCRENFLRPAPQFAGERKHVRAPGFRCAWNGTRRNGLHPPRSRRPETIRVHFRGPDARALPQIIIETADFRGRPQQTDSDCVHTTVTWVTLDWCDCGRIPSWTQTEPKRTCYPPSILPNQWIKCVKQLQKHYSCKMYT